MAKYLTRLWDDYSKILLTNMRDIDARDDDYPDKVATRVWASVDSLRSKRTAFFKLIRDEARRKADRQKKPAPR